MSDVERALNGRTSPSPAGVTAKTEPPTEELLVVWPHLRRVGARSTLRDYLADVWSRREFALMLPKGQLRAQNQDTLAGQLWHLLNPLLLVGVYWFIFGVVVDLTRGGIDNYVGFLVAGIIPYQFTQKSVQSGARIIVGNRQLIQSINFPRAILPFAAMIEEVMAHVPAIAVMVVLLFSTGEQVTWWWLLIVPVTAVQALFNLGLVFLASRATFHFRDIEQMLRYVLRLWFYISGILFSVEQLSADRELLRIALQLNPANAIVRLVRVATMEGGTEAFPWLVLGGWSALFVLVGFVYFRRAESEYGRV